MLLLRLLVTLLLLAAVACYATFLFTGRDPWRLRSKRLFIGSCVLVVGFIVILALEHLVERF
jgi:hypothetical protein